jgi:hypothetical protein
MCDEGGTLHSLPPYQNPECNRKVRKSSAMADINPSHYKSAVSNQPFCLADREHPKAIRSGDAQIKSA